MMQWMEGAGAERKEEFESLGGIKNVAFFFSLGNLNSLSEYSLNVENIIKDFIGHSLQHCF